MGQKRQAGAGQAAHLFRSVTGHVQGGGAACGVVAWLRFALQNDDTAVRRQPVADGCTGNAGADDEEVGFVDVCAPVW